jgi:hypothetical protein
MSKQAIKKNISSMQVLKTLQILLEGNYTMAELIEKLNANESEPIFNNSVVSKYINTCRYCGIEIPKIHNRYFVSKLPFGLDLTSKDLDLLDELRYMSDIKLSKNARKNLDEFLKKLAKFSNKHIIRVEEQNTDAAFELFEEAIEEKRMIVLMFRAKALLECRPVAIIEKKGKPFFHVIYKKKDKYIAADRISGLQVLDTKFMPDQLDTVIYELTGGLKDRYTLRENEMLAPSDKTDCLAVSCECTDKDALLSRLLRYGENCKIVKPIEYRDAMKSLLDGTLANYGVELSAVKC